MDFFENNSKKYCKDFVCHKHQFYGECENCKILNGSCDYIDITFKKNYSPCYRCYHRDYNFDTKQFICDLKE